MKWPIFVLALFFFLFKLVAAQALDAKITLSARGNSGVDGRNGRDFGFSRALDGRNAFIHGDSGGAGSDGQNGGDATPAENGSEGGTIIFTAYFHPTKPNTFIYSAKVNGQDLPETEAPLTDETKIILDAGGGRGGQGGSGGSAQSGGNGGSGGDSDRYHPRAGDGGRGGHGGNPGRSTNGGNGGRGGRIEIHIRAGEEKILSLIETNVSGGMGGMAPNMRPRAGDGGSGGRPGNHCYYDENNQHKCAIPGVSGMNGISGNPSISYPSSGLGGINGIIEVKTIP